MNFIKKHLDLFLSISIAIFLFFVVFIFQGFAKYGFAIPYLYEGGDDLTNYLTQKLIEETGWFWYNDRIGAPIGATSFDFSAYLLMNFDMILAVIVSWFIKNPIVAVNFRFVLIFPMVGVISYFVLRALKVNRFFSSFGAIIYALTPYIFLRNISHLSLSTIYFIPLSILLCIWAIYDEDNDYLKLNKNFFKNKKNILTIIFSLLIANNGIGYYAFFTCFFLCVIALYNFMEKKNWKSILNPIKIIVLIGSFFILALLPSVIYNLRYGSNPLGVIRSMQECEIYGLKISHLIIPPNSDNVIIKKISALYDQMPLVNENRFAYLGVFGIIGFVCSILFLIKRNNNDENNERNRILFVFSIMNICAILLATIGGFSSIIALFFKKIRGYNRISVFIMFISVAFLCISLQKFFENKTFKTIKGKRIFTILGIFMMVLCVVELIPSYGNRDSYFEKNKINYNSDKKFVEHIESTLGENAMVFQLPYHEYPESGPVYNMNDYHLFIGYIYSNTLRWSYGGTKGREASEWNKYAASLPLDEMLEYICKSGFTGLYIDARAYNEDELQELKSNIYDLVKTNENISDNGNLIFYDLRNYIASNGIEIG